MFLNEKFEKHAFLNPAIWTKNHEMLPEVHDKLMKIVERFKNEIEVDITIVDARIVGSNASFNYTDQSDIDLHIIVNFDLLQCDQNIASILYKVLAKQFCNKYNISIHGIPVEIYIEDMSSQVVSNGVYSLFEKRWLKFPKKITEIPIYDVSREVQGISNRINLMIKNNDLPGLIQEDNRIYNIRKQSIADEGEYSKGNQLFKELRNLGVISKLKDAITELKGKQLSLESLNKQ